LDTKDINTFAENILRKKFWYNSVFASSRPFRKTESTVKEVRMEVFDAVSRESKT